MSEALARHRVPATLLKLELTERTLMVEHTRVVDTLVALEALDVELSLDDFGTGYSSMFMLKRLPVSEIKVDRSFVSRLAADGEDASIVRSHHRPRPRARAAGGRRGRRDRGGLGPAASGSAATRRRAGSSAARCRPRRPRSGCASTYASRRAKSEAPAVGAALPLRLVAEADRGSTA